MRIKDVTYSRDGSILAKINGESLSIPDNLENRHRQIVAEWEAAGNKIDPYGSPLPTIDDFRTAIQSLIDAKAQGKQYDSGATLASYINSTIPQWSAEATTFVAWRDQVWAYAQAELDKVQNGEREQPSVEVFLTELPTFEWPES